MEEWVTRNAERVIGSAIGCAAGLALIGWLLSREWEPEKYPPDTPS